MLDLTTDLTAAIAERKQHERFRQLKNVAPVNAVEISWDGKTYLNFSSNDYLGLSQHPLLKERAIEFINRYGVGSGASRLVSGNNEAYDVIEDKLAKLKGTEAALVFSTGYQLNLTVLIALAELEVSFFCDRLSHNSILTGVSFSQAKFARFKHNDLADLEEKLASFRTKATTGWILTESLFGMDGDFADLARLVSLSQRVGTKLFVDEAHATGVFGENGMGLASQHKGIDLIMGTFGKGLGSFGAYIACSKQMRDYLINFCSGFIYTTALPPPVLGAIDAALEIVPTMSKERKHLLALAEHAQTEIKSLGFDVGLSASQIIPVIIGKDLQVTSLAQYLADSNIFVSAIRPPTVPDGTARLRLSLSAQHTEAHIEKLIKALKQWRAASKS